MIDFFQGWLPQLLGYAELVENEEVLRRAWMEGCRSETSLYYPGELTEQLFGDLSASEMTEEINNNLSHHPQIVDAIKSFIQSVADLDDWLEDTVDTAKWSEGNGPPYNAELLFSTDQWEKCRVTARNLVRLAEAAGYNSGDYNPPTM